jgi:large subunit ribosomal protein L4
VKLPLNNLRGSVVREIDVRDDVFARRQNDAVVHQVMVGQLANRRQGTAKVKNRSAVSGGGIKPRPQKYTGRARAGTIRAPHWKGGGTVFGPTPRSYRQRTPKRMRKLALVTTLSSKAREGGVIVLEDLNLANAKTKELITVLGAVGAGSSVLLVADGASSDVIRASNNIPRLKAIPSQSLNATDILNFQSIVMTEDAVRNAEAIWGGRFERKPSPALEAAEGEEN